MILVTSTKCGDVLARTGSNMELVDNVVIPNRNTVLPPN